MDKPKHSTLKNVCKKIATIFLVVSLTQTVFAVDGTMNGGGKAKKSSFSNIKKNLNISLRSGFNISNKSFNSRQGDKVTMVNSMMSFQKGNVTIFIPYKTKTFMQKFKTPMAPAIR
jgi:hypothetical protein